VAKPSPIDNLNADTPLDEAARRALAVRLADVRAWEERVAYHRDADSVHDMRVGTRRLRAAIALFDDGSEALEEAEVEVRRLGDALGNVRDRDVQIEWLEGVLTGPVDASERVGIEQLLAERREELPAYEQALTQVHGRWRTEVVGRLEQTFARVSGRGRLGGAGPRKHLRKRLLTVDERIDLVLASSANAYTAHRLRISVKKLRYDAELLDPALPDVTGPLLQALQPLQETLGDLHDRDVRLPLIERFLVRCATHAQPGAIRLLAMDLAERDRLAAELTVDLRHWQAEGRGKRLRQSLRRDQQ
jgi:CHAD domain-containing protein